MTRMKRIIICLCLLALAVPAEGALFGKEKYPEDTDIVVKASPVRVRLADASTAIDARVETEKQTDTDIVVAFMITDVLKGKFLKEKVKSQSKVRQISNAMRNRDYGRLLQLKPEDQLVEKTVLRIAVKDPLETFGIISWENPEDREYTIYLRKTSEKAGTYWMTGVDFKGKEMFEQLSAGQKTL